MTPITRTEAITLRKSKPKLNTQDRAQITVSIYDSPQNSKLYGNYAISALTHATTFLSMNPSLAKAHR